MPRFVLLEHDHPYLHCDLMLQVENVLWTWRLDAPLSLAAVTALRISDHRLFYLDYEGAVSGNRGTVRRLAHGELFWHERDETRVKVTLKGDRLRGILNLRRLDTDRWEAVYLPSTSE